MSDPAIKAALEEAAKASKAAGQAYLRRARDTGDWNAAQCGIETSAAAVAAFLRHFRRGNWLYSFTIPDASGMPTDIDTVFDSLAAAVEEVARDG